MRKGTGQAILDEVFAGPPLGADMRQMRATQDGEQPDDDDLDEKAGTCPNPGEKRRSRGKGRGLARGQGKGPLGVPAGEKGDEDDDEEEEEDEDEYESRGELDSAVPHQSLVSFQSFYVEGKFEEAARAMAEGLGIGEGDDPMTVDEEMVKAEWARYIAEADSKFAFMRKAIMKFRPFMMTAQTAWDKLSDKQKESAIQHLKSKSAKMASELKNLLSGLTEKSPADKVLMAVMLAYMFGIGMSGEGAMASESSGGE